VAKAMSYMYNREYEPALPYLEKALEYNPNSAFVINMLADYYTNHVPNSGKYLQFALRAARLDIGANDSITTSFIYLRLGNALIQNGFVDESLAYIDKSLLYHPKNPFAKYIRAFILYAKTNDLRLTHNLLIEEFKKDTTRIDILQDIGKTSYHLGEFDSAYYYYKKFNALREQRKLDVYKHENLTIGYVYEQMGFKKEAKELVESFRLYSQTDKSLYKDLGISMYYSYVGDTKKAIEHLKLFSKEEDYQYWVILFLYSDPIIKEIKELPEFKKIMKGMEDRFWERHKELEVILKEKELI
jgi:tetratricopeptide (TPR) repeat protein